MKQFITSLLMITYMAAAIGFSCSFHYCGGSFHDICFTGDTEKDCCGPMEDTSGCCEDKVVCASQKDDHAPSSFHVLLTKTTTSFLPSVIYTNVARLLQRHFVTLKTYRKGPAPPLISDIPLYLFIRVLRL